MTMRCAIRISGAYWYELGHHDVLSVVEQIAADLHGLNGNEEYSIVLWRIPATYPDNRDSPREDDTAVEYIQSAGAADRLTIEVRQRDGENGYTNYAIGREPTSETTALEETVHWSDFTVDVARSELFTSEEAIPIYDEYRQTGRVPAEFHLRPIPGVG